MPLTKELTKFTTATGTLVNVDFQDQLLGNGVLQFTAALVGDSVNGVTKRLTTSDFRPLETPDNKPYEYTNVKRDTVNKEFDFDFDSVPLTKALTLQGELMAQIPFMNSKDSEVYFIIKLREWDGTTETDIASVQSPTFDPQAGSDTNTYQYASIPLIVPKTKIQAGNQIRITLETWFKSTTISRALAVFFDAQDGEATDYFSTLDREAGTTKMIFDIPVKV